MRFIPFRGTPRKDRLGSGFVVRFVLLRDLNRAQSADDLGDLSTGQLFGGLELRSGHTVDNAGVVERQNVLVVGILERVLLRLLRETLRLRGDLAELESRDGSVEIDVGREPALALRQGQIAACPVGAALRGLLLAERQSDQLQSLTVGQGAVRGKGRLGHTADGLVLDQILHVRIEPVVCLHIGELEGIGIRSKCGQLVHIFISQRRTQDIEDLCVQAAVELRLTVDGEGVLFRVVAHILAVAEVDQLLAAGVSGEVGRTDDDVARFELLVARVGVTVIAELAPDVVAAPAGGNDHTELSHIGSGDLALLTEDIRLDLGGSLHDLGVLGGDGLVVREANIETEDLLVQNVCQIVGIRAVVSELLVVLTLCDLVKLREDVCIQLGAADLNGDGVRGDVADGAGVKGDLGAERSGDRVLSGQSLDFIRLQSNINRHGVAIDLRTCERRLDGGADGCLFRDGHSVFLRGGVGELDGHGDGLTGVGAVEAGLVQGAVDGKTRMGNAVLRLGGDGILCLGHGLQRAEQSHPAAVALGVVGDVGLRIVDTDGAALGVRADAGAAAGIDAVGDGLVLTHVFSLGEVLVGAAAVDQVGLAVAGDVAGPDHGVSAVDGILGVDVTGLRDREHLLDFFLDVLAFILDKVPYAGGIVLRLTGEVTGPDLTLVAHQLIAECIPVDLAREVRANGVHRLVRGRSFRGRAVGRTGLAVVGTLDGSILGLAVVLHAMALVKIGKSRCPQLKSQKLFL